jgi:AraC-like DNA-binding protein
MRALRRRNPLAPHAHAEIVSPLSERVTEFYPPLRRRREKPGVSLGSTLDDQAQVCGLSRFQMSRLFTYATWKTVTAYVRGRRLTEAARVLADGAPDILAVPLQAG